MDSTREEIVEVMIEEQKRGTTKAPNDVEARKAQREVENAILKLVVSDCDRREFIRLLTGRLKLPMGSDRYHRAVQAFDQYRQQRHMKKRR